MIRDAVLSPCGTYRYRLTRTWDDGEPPLTLVMLNPSTADAEHDDPTIRRCMSFARREGLGGIIVVNLYAYRATHPAALSLASDPVGPDNDGWLSGAAYNASDWGAPLIAAWGAHARPERVRAVLDLPGFDELVSLGTTKTGAPRHPLYVRGDAPLVPWSLAVAA